LTATDAPVYNDLLDMLLNFRNEEMNSPMDDKLLRDEVTTIFMAGHETTAQTLGWMLYHLAKEKNITNKLKAEAGSVCNNQMLLFDDIPKLTYTKQVIQETLRMYPPIWAVVRTPLTDDNVHGLYIPKHSNVLLNIYGLHHHPDYWEKPDEFYPNHFSVDAEKQRPAFVFNPFGGGPRLCLGHNFAMLVMNIIISRVTQSFEFNVPEGYKPRVEPNITLRARNGIQLLIKKI
jgi:cytochrome P450